MLGIFSLQDRCALVTGANTGLGQAMAVAMAGAGADIVAAGRSEPVETARMVRDLGRRFHFVAADLAEGESAAAVVAEAISVHGQLDILVNNAGTIHREPALEFSAAAWDQVFNVNLRTPFLLAQAAARHMASRGTGKIINTVSMLSYQGGVNVASYTASKSGLLGLTRALCNEWAPKGINVNGIAPGYFATEITRPLREDPVRSKDILARIPAGDWGQPEDLAGAVIYLASRASHYVHGTIIPVDGGWLSR